MNAHELRNLQAPLKELYRNEPASALITLTAVATLNSEVSCSVQTGKAMVEAGLHPSTGGTGALACSGDLLLQALVACAGVTVKAVATAINIDITEGTIHAEGELDFRGTLGVDKDVPVGFKSIRLQFNLQTQANPEQIQTLQKLTERYCVVYQTLVKGVNIDSAFSCQ
jgi:uncharacterized OsmC-like protein